MLTHLHVKNLAIVEDIEVDFDNKLNILTGETGVGKSIIIGSINIALGARVSADMIRTGAEYALVEMVFEPDDATWESLREYDIYPESGVLIISRKITNGRSVSKVNGETVTIAALKDIAGHIIDIHGQHEHQSLLYADKHLEIIDRYVRNETDLVKADIAECYEKYCSVKKEWDAMSFSEEDRKRELSFVEFEKNEIEEAGIQPGEEEILETEYKRLSNSGKIVEAMDYVYGLTGSGNMSASYLIGNALSRIRDIAEYDDEISGYADALSDVENVLTDFNRDVSSYMSDYTFDEGLLKETEDRLDYIRRLFAKYGGSYDGMQKHYEELQERWNQLINYEEHKKELDRNLNEIDTKLRSYYDRLTDIRTKAADKIKVLIKESLVDLNFIDVNFDIAITHNDVYSKNGLDQAEFMISTNPGEPLKPLGKVASGGELSRIMLAVKAVLADSDSINTLVFDEIDTGISGRTAQKVSEKLAYISKTHQIICITHLAQIAAMADEHYVIEKNVESGRTKTDIRWLSSIETENELARILGGAEITDSVIASAREMKHLAEEWKASH